MAKQLNFTSSNQKRKVRTERAKNWNVPKAGADQRKAWLAAYWKRKEKWVLSNGADALRDRQPQRKSRKKVSLAPVKAFSELT